MVEHLRNMKKLCRALHSDKDDRDMIVLRELLEGVMEDIKRLPAQERDLDLKGKILHDFYLLMERCEKGSSRNILDTTSSAFPTSTKPLKFRNPLSTSQLFLHINLKTPPFLSSSFEQIRMDRVRELLEALREDLQQLRPPPWAITHHRKIIADLNIILGRPLFYPPPVRWTGSAQEHKALQSDVQFDVTQWLNTYDFDVWRNATPREHIFPQTLPLNEFFTSHTFVARRFLLRHCEIRTSAHANSRLTGLPTQSQTLGSHAWNRRLNSYPREIIHTGVLCNDSGFSFVTVFSQ